MSTSDPEDPLEPIEPLKHYVIGLGLPFFVALIFGCVSVMLALINSWSDVLTALKWGVGVGLFVSLWGGLEMAVGILFIDGRFQNRLWMCFGFLSIWVPSVYAVLNFDLW